MPSRILLPVALAVVMFGLGVTAQAGPNTQDSPPSGDYVGSQACMECHDDQWPSFRMSVHYQNEKEGEWAGKACEACHGPGSEHVESEGETPMIFGSMGDFGVQVKSNQCLTCHAKNESSSHFRSSDHIKGTIDCSTCHKTHEGARYDNLIPPQLGARSDSLDYRAGQEACLQCHDEIRTSANLNERHRINEGMVKCADCHNQHGQSARTQLGGFKYETCVECHTDKEGPWVFEHLSNRVEGCNACHTPHGNVNRHMLTHQNVGELCYSCHVLVPGFHQPGVRFGNDANCTNCHSSIHGSNINKDFLR